MILEIVTFKSPRDGTARASSRMRKRRSRNGPPIEILSASIFCCGIGEAEGTGAGVYVWPSIEAAQKAHDEDWRAAVRKRTGGEPTIRYFDLFLLIDNAQGVVTEFAADGRSHVLDPA